MLGYMVPYVYKPATAGVDMAVTLAVLLDSAFFCAWYSRYSYLSLAFVHLSFQLAVAVACCSFLASYVWHHPKHLIATQIHMLGN